MPTARLQRLPRRALADGRLEVPEARSPLARLCGLAGLRALEPGEALLLDRCRSVHTLGMRFPLDLVWLDARDRVLRVDEAVAPGRLRGCRSARAVLEVRAGEGAQLARRLAAAEHGR